jgi:hypothetical protein
MLSYSLTATTVIGLPSSRFSSLRLPSGAPTLPSFRVSRVRARPGCSLARPVRQLACAASLITNLYGLKISDLGPFRAAGADALRAIELEETTYGWAVKLILKGATQGFRIVEVPVSYHPRVGKSKISGTFRRAAGATWVILSRIARYYFRHEKTASHGRREIPPGNTYGTSNER